MKYIPVIVISLLVVTLLFGPWKIPYGFRTAARIMPVQAWELIQYPDGSMMSRWHDNRLDGIKDQQLYQFDRGDVIHMEYQLDSLSENWVPADYEVVAIESNRLSEQLLGVSTQLQQQRALLNVDRIGQKPQTLERLEEEVRLARQTRTLLVKQKARQTELLAEGLSSVAQFEQVENALAEADLRVEVAEKALVEARAGEKPEQIEWIETRINALQTTAEFLEGKEALYSVVCPIAGSWRREMDLDGAEHLWVEDTTAAVVQIPVRERDLAIMQDSFQLVIMEGDRELRFDILQWKKQGPRSILNNEQVQWVKLTVPGLKCVWIDGKPVPCRIESGEVSVLKYLEEAFEWRW
ncbi:MAG: hypothetical protein GYB31_07110 [Bacteroidetes bacterium]|nr:hypothetical protein [Bacteroidota bacterium]